MLLEAKTKHKTLIVVSCRLVLLPELEREITVVEFALPGKKALRDVLGSILESAGIKDPAIEPQEKAVEAACGLTTIEAENTFALSYVQNRTIEALVVAREKAHAVKKSGLLEIIEARESLDSIGGLDVLKDGLLKRRNAFTQRAADYGLPPANGLLIIGIAGTGKSLTAKVLVRVFGVPLLKLDPGRLHGGLVGQSRSEPSIGHPDGGSGCALLLVGGRDREGSGREQVVGADPWWHVSANAWFAAELYDAFDRDTGPTDLDIIRVLTAFVPLSKTMVEQISALRTWVTGRARFATSATVTERRLRKLVA